MFTQIDSLDICMPLQDIPLTSVFERRVDIITLLFIVYHSGQYTVQDDLQTTISFFSISAVIHTIFPVYCMDICNRTGQDY